MLDWLDIRVIADRASGRLGGLNSENGSVNDAKNLRVKVRLLHAIASFFLFGHSAGITSYI